jgi:hypothetical protein
MCHQTNANGYRYLRGLRLLSGCVATRERGVLRVTGFLRNRRSAATRSRTEQKVRRD